jgi:hypothetical protein
MDFHKGEELGGAVVFQMEWEHSNDGPIESKWNRL